MGVTSPPVNQSAATPARLLARELEDAVRGEVRFDRGSRALYATDASNYRQVPIGVVIPRDRRRRGRGPWRSAAGTSAPMLPRGCGTSLAGQCCNVAVVIDFSKYLNNVARDRRRSQAGACPARHHPRRASRRRPASTSLTYGPDPATHDALHARRDDRQQLVRRALTDVRARRATTSRSSRSCSTTARGCASVATVRRGARGDHRRRRARGEIYARAAAQLRDRYGDRDPQPSFRTSRGASPATTSTRSSPRTASTSRRRWSAREATCVIVLEATCPPGPRARGTLPWSCSATPTSTQPPIDVPRSLEVQADRARGDRRSHDRGHQGESGSRAEDVDAAARRPGLAARRIRRRRRRRRRTARRARWSTTRRRPDAAPESKLFDDSEDQERIWKVRESGLGATAYVPGKPTVVGRLGGFRGSARTGSATYLRDLSELLEQLRLQTASLRPLRAGLRAHPRSISTSTTAAGIATFRAFLDEAARSRRAVRRLALGRARRRPGARRAAAEHVRPGADGGVPRVQDASGTPTGKMNPGKVVDPYPLDEDLRLGTDYQPIAGRRTSSSPTTGGSFASRDHAVRRRRRMPAARRRHDVPELHGDARREALDARPRAAAVRDDAGNESERRLARRRR